MATILCNKPACLKVVLFGQRLDFKKVGSAINARAHSGLPAPNVTEQPATVKQCFDEAAAWFASASPRATTTVGPCFGQEIRLREDPPGTVIVEAMHDGQPGATDKPAETEVVVSAVQGWFSG